MFSSNVCDYSDAYIVVKGTIVLLAAAANENNKAEKNVAFKNNAPFRSRISKINSTLIDNAEDLDMVMPIYNLLISSQKYSMTSGRLWSCYRDEINDADDNSSDNKSSKYMNKVVGKKPERPPRPGNPGGANWPAQTAEPFLINSEIELNLSWKKDCVLIEHHNDTTGEIFTINSTKLYALLVTLSTNDNINFLENIKQRFKRTISCNKYRSEVATQTENKNLDYLIDPTFRNINRFFVLSFKHVDDDPKEYILLSVTCYY